MRNAVAIGLLAGMLVAASGCAHNSVVAHNTISSGAYYGTDGIFGHNNTRTIERESRLDKISIIGDGNSYIIEDNVMLKKVEILGQDNTVSVPEGLVIRWTTIGQGNKLVRRPGVLGETPPATAADAKPAEGKGVEKAAEDMPPRDKPKSP